MSYRVAKRNRKKGNKIKNQNPKLRNNAIFVKPIQNPMNKIDVNIVITR